MRRLHFNLSRAASVLLCLVVVSSTFAQSKSVATGVITGRVMIGENPAVGVMVGLVRAEPNSPLNQGGAIIKDATDNDGRYRLAQVPAGNYRVTTLAPVYVSPIDSPGFFERGKTVKVEDGETIDNLDFKLIRGGVITGKVTDTGGKPLIEERISVWKGEPDGRKGAWNSVGTNFTMLQTDDRGMYRIYGLPEGRYLISAGEAANSQRMYQRGLTYRRTFYPNVTDEAQAQPVEVTPGSETKDIDLRLSTDTLKGSTVTIRVVDAESGAPLSGQSVGIATIVNERYYGAQYFEVADARGIVRLDNVLPGRYGVTVRAGSTPSEYFSELTTFEVQGNDVEGVEVRAQRGATLSGKVVIEGNNDPTLWPKFLELQMSAHSVPTPRGTSAPPMQIIAQGFKVSLDGSFQVRGLGPGRVSVNANNRGGQSSFTLMRMEVEGVPQKDGIEVIAGQQVNNVRVVYGYGQATVRGQVDIVNGALPDGARVFVNVRRTDGQNSLNRGAPVDARGRFVIESLLPGEYELILTASPRMVVGQGPDGTFGTSNQPTPALPRTLRQKITVPAIGEVQARFTLDLAAREGQQ
jgi:hypothetical protein